MYISRRALHPSTVSPALYLKYQHSPCVMRGIHCISYSHQIRRTSPVALANSLLGGALRLNGGPYIPLARYMSTDTSNPHNKPITPPEKQQIVEAVTDKDKKGLVGFVKKWDVKIRKIISHYWLGTKLLSQNVAVTTKLLRAIMNGHKMTRRERKLLVQTTADIFRLIPFIIIILVPFMELALPFLLKFFPNMLPSTYEWKSKKEEDRAKRLKANLEMAKFLQETMTEVSVDMKKVNVINANYFSDFMQKVKNNEKVTNKDILKVSQLFQDELTLDKISREQLIAMNKYLSGSSTLPGKWFSTDFLRTRLGNKIEKIKQDDKLIRREGLDTLTLEELVDASLVRGMKVEGLNREKIKQHLQEWLDLSQNQNVPPSLLILSRAFMLTQKIRPEEALEDTLAHIPAEALEEVARELPPDEDERARERLAELEKEKALLAKTVKEEQEREKEKKKLEKEKKKKEEEEKKRKEKEKEKEGEDKKVVVAAAANTAAEETIVKGINIDATKKIIAAAAEVADEQEKEIIHDIEQDIEVIKHQQEILEDVLEEMPKEALEDKRPKVLAEKLKDILHDLEEEIEKIEKEHEEEDEKKEKLQVADKDEKKVDMKVDKS